MTKSFKQIVYLISIIVFFTASAFTLLISSPSETGVVHAVLFWMEGCLHCEDVIENIIPPIQEKYGNQFQLQLIELAGSREVTALYDLAESMGIPQNDVGVPFLMIGNHVLIGSGEIPNQLPALIDSYLAAGGVDFPDSAALAPLLPQQASAETDKTPESSAASQAVPTAENPAAGQITPPPLNEPSTPAAPLEIPAFQGNGGFVWAWLTLFLLTGALAFSLIYIFQNRAAFSAATLSNSNYELSDWLTPFLALVGLGVAAYLAYVETQAVRAFCGPVGDCNTVQSSPYACLFGVLPIGVLGVFGYALILAAWWVRRSRNNPWSGWAALALLGMSLGGTLFSIDLTYLEIAVIRAVCLWCLSSALIMGGLLVVSLHLEKPLHPSK